MYKAEGFYPCVCVCVYMYVMGEGVNKLSLDGCID